MRRGIFQTTRLSFTQHETPLKHSLEVQLPFLQVLLGKFTLVPLVVGESAPYNVPQVLERLWGDDETLIVVSSDLSHYHAYAALLYARA